jgi:class 3 adenylate cyclase
VGRTRPRPTAASLTEAYTRWTMQGAGSELPTGTVTFLMTDIERSTELVRRLGDRWPALAGEHRRLVREAVSEAAGHEVDARGEELFFVFRRAADAVVAAAGAQRALTEHEWPPDAEVRVRMGIHTGEPALGDDGGYLGIDVHRTARICAAGHGGQVLVSETTRSLVPDMDVRFLDLGEQHFKGFERDERVYQLAAAGLVERFPPLAVPSIAAFEGDERSLGAAAQALVSRGRPRVPRVMRHRPPVARRLGELSWHVRSLQDAAPEHDRPALLELARSLVVLSRTANDADRSLARLDRKALEQKLAETRQLGVRSRYAQRRADTLARQVAVVDELAGARRALDERIGDLERRASAVDGAAARALRADVDSLDHELAEALESVTAEIGQLAERLHRTRHPGVYRQGDLWAIPYFDSQGVERVRRFDDLGRPGASADGCDSSTEPTRSPRRLRLSGVCIPGQPGRTAATATEEATATARCSRAP